VGGGAARLEGGRALGRQVRQACGLDEGVVEAVVRDEPADEDPDDGGERDEGSEVQLAAPGWVGVSGRGSRWVIGGGWRGRGGTWSVTSSMIMVRKRRRRPEPAMSAVAPVRAKRPGSAAKAAEAKARHCAHGADDCAASRPRRSTP
jgi:hypothetical protein